MSKNCNRHTNCKILHARSISDICVPFPTRITFECTKCGYENCLATVFKNPKFFRGIIRSLEGEKNVFAQDQIAGLKAKFECSKCRCNNYSKRLDFLLRAGRKDRKLGCASWTAVFYQLGRLWHISPNCLTCSERIGLTAESALKWTWRVESTTTWPEEYLTSSLFYATLHSQALLSAKNRLRAPFWCQIW